MRKKISILLCLALFGFVSTCSGASTFQADGHDGEGEDTAAEDMNDVSVEADGIDSGDPREDTGYDAAEQEVTVGCTGDYAYLHGDLWPMWYNMRVACDPEHKAWWRCERIHGEGASDCASLGDMYDDCITNWDSGRCMDGVYAPETSTGCWECDPEWPEGTCDTRTFDYDSDETWGSYYGVQWPVHVNWHRHLTIRIKDSSGADIAAFSTCPTREDCYMDGENFGVGPEPQGFIQPTPSEERYTARFGTFACIRVPSNLTLVLWASWMNEFCHTCSPDYPSYPHVPCWTEDIPMIFEPGRHYLWTEKGIERMDGCSGPPPYIVERLPEAACDTSSP